MTHGRERNGHDSPIPAVTASQMAEVDRIAVDELGLELPQMMEMAGRSLAEVAKKVLGGGVAGKRVTVMAGLGNNAGGGLVAARHLVNSGAEVTVVLATHRGGLRDVPSRRLGTLEGMGVSIREPATNQSLFKVAPADLLPADLLVDALLGYNVDGPPREGFAALITSANASGRPILALDVPSGLDATAGAVYEPCIHATATLTLALPKTGLAGGVEVGVVGDVFLADIGIPEEVYRRMGLSVGMVFHRDSIVPLDHRDGKWYRGSQEFSPSPSR